MVGIYFRSFPKDPDAATDATVNRPIRLAGEWRYFGVQDRDERSRIDLDIESAAASTYKDRVADSCAIVDDGLALCPLAKGADAADDVSATSDGVINRGHGGLLCVARSGECLEVQHLDDRNYRNDQIARIELGHERLKDHASLDPELLYSF